MRLTMFLAFPFARRSVFHNNFLLISHLPAIKLLWESKPEKLWISCKLGYKKSSESKIEFHVRCQSKSFAFSHLVILCPADLCPMVLWYSTRTFLSRSRRIGRVKRNLFIFMPDGAICKDADGLAPSCPAYLMHESCVARGWSVLIGRRQ